MNHFIYTSRHNCSFFTRVKKVSLLSFYLSQQKVKSGMPIFINSLIIKTTISSIVIGLKTLLFSTNSLAKLLSDSLLLDTLLLDSLLSDSSIHQSHSKL